MAIKYNWTCKKCDKQFVVIEYINGECPHCKSKYIWDWDCEFEDAVFTIFFD